MFALRKHFGKSTEPRRATGRRVKFRPFFENLEERAVPTAGTGWSQPQSSWLWPGTVRQAYGFNSIPAFTVNGQSVAADGTGQTIAIVDFFDDPNIFGDLAVFDQTFGLPDPPSFQVIGEYGLNGTLPQKAPVGTGYASETSLDVEWAHAMAPGANILLVEANGNIVNGQPGFSTADADQALLTAASFPGVSVVSISASAAPPVDSTNAPKLLSSAGVTFVSTASDHGTFHYPYGGPDGLIVGGTQLSVNSDNSYQGESTWFQNPPPNWSTGGGEYPDPPAGVHATPIPSWQATRWPGYTNRISPDVAYAAINPPTNNPAGNGFAIFDSWDWQASTTVNNSGSWINTSGTSAGAPQWAALIAIANQGRALELPSRGPLNGLDPTLPMLYSLPSGDFNQIPISGSQLSDPHFVFDTFYTGAYVVGSLGSPRADRLIPDLVQPFHGYSSRVVENIQQVNGAATVVSGQLVVYGNEGQAASDQISLSYSTNPQGRQLLTVTDNGQSDSFDLTTFNSVVIYCRAAADTVTVPMTPALYPAIDVTVEGGQGSDQLIVDDTANSDATNFTVTDTSVQRTFAGMVTFSSVAQVTIQGGSGINNYHVQNTDPNATTEIHTGDGTDHVYVEGTQGPLTVDLGNNPLDTVELSAIAQSLDNLAGGVSVNGTLVNGSGQGALILDDQNTPVLSTTFPDKAITFAVDSAGTVGSGSVTRTEGELLGRRGWVSFTLTFGFTNLANLVVNGGNVPLLGNTFNVESTPSGLTTDLYGGNGGAAFTLGATGENLLALGGAVKVHGQGGTTTLTLDDQNRPSIAFYTLTSTSFNDGPTWRQLTYDGIQTLTVNAVTNWSNTLGVQSTSASTTINEGTAQDAVNVGDATHSLDSLRGQLTVSGGTGTTLTVDDRALADRLTPDGFAAVPTFTSYTLSVPTPGNGQLVRTANEFATAGLFAGQQLPSTATLSYSNLAGLSVDGYTNAPNLFAVQATLAGTPVTLNAGTGRDTVIVGDANNTLGGIQGAVDVIGTGNTTLSFNDLGGNPGAAPQQVYDYYLAQNTFSRTGTATVTFSGMASVNVQAANAANTGGWNAIWVSGTAAGTSYQVNAGTGENEYIVGYSSQWLNGIQGPLYLHGAGGTLPNDDFVLLYDVDKTTHHTLVLTGDGTSNGGFIQRDGVTNVHYDALDAYVVLQTAGSIGTTVDVQGEAPNLYTAIYVGSPDKVTIGNTSHTMAGIAGDILISADQGTTPTVTLDDAQDPKGETVTLSTNPTYGYQIAGLLPPSSVGRGRIWLEQGTAMQVTLKTGAGSTPTNDIFQVNDLTAAPAMKIDAGNGSNTLVGPNQPTTWTITGANSGKLGPISFSHVQNLVGGSASDVFKFGPNGSLSGSINGGGGGDWLDYSAYTAPVAVNLATGTGTSVAGGINNIQNVHGGNHGNTLTGNAQGNILIGGSGSNTITGGSGMSLLIADKGPSTITGGSGGDILIGDYTTYDAMTTANELALMSILAEWQSADSYAVRFHDINTGTGGGLNGTAKLNWGTTVKDDGAPDAPVTLTAAPSALALDWFFLDTNDTKVNYETGEHVNNT
jgi:hypothetical protein